MSVSSSTSATTTTTPCYVYSTPKLADSLANKYKGYVLVPMDATDEEIATTARVRQAHRKKSDLDPALLGPLQPRAARQRRSSSREPAAAASSSASGAIAGAGAGDHTAAGSLLRTTPTEQEKRDRILLLRAKKKLLEQIMRERNVVVGAPLAGFAEPSVPLRPAAQTNRRRKMSPASSSYSDPTYEDEWASKRSRSNRVIKAPDLLDASSNPLPLASKVKALLNKLLKEQGCEFFAAPVDTNYVTDYLTVIKDPMDIGTIMNRIDAAAYTALDQVKADLDLIWRNCMTYNKTGPVLEFGRKLMKSCNDKWARLLAPPTASSSSSSSGTSATRGRKKASRGRGGGGRGGKSRGSAAAAAAASSSSSISSRPQPPSASRGGENSSKNLDSTPLNYLEKQALKEDIFKLEGENLENVVEIISQNMPQQANETGEEDEIEIDIDLLDIPTLRKLQRFVRASLAEQAAAAAAATEEYDDDYDGGGGGGGGKRKRGGDHMYNNNDNNNNNNQFDDGGVETISASTTIAGTSAAVPPAAKRARGTTEGFGDPNSSMYADADVDATAAAAATTTSSRIVNNQSSAMDVDEEDEGAFSQWGQQVATSGGDGGNHENTSDEDPLLREFRERNRELQDKETAEKLAAEQQKQERERAAAEAAERARVEAEQRQAAEEAAAAERARVEEERMKQLQTQRELEEKKRRELAAAAANNNNKSGSSSNDRDMEGLGGYGGLESLF